MIPTGTTRLVVGDAVMLVGRDETIREAMDLFGGAADDDPTVPAPP